MPAVHILRRPAPMHPSWRLRATLPVLLALCACGGGDLEVSIPPPPTEPAVPVFEFRIRAADATQTFRVAIDSPEVVAQARAELQLPEDERNLHVIGGIAAGDGGVNGPWGWHFTGARFFEMSAEYCDGTPGLVQADLAYWLTTVKTYCPWSSYVVAEVG